MKAIHARPCNAENSQKCLLPGFFCDFTVLPSSFTGISFTTSIFSRLLWYHAYPFFFFFLIGIYPTQSLQLASAAHELPSSKSGTVTGKYLRRPVPYKCHFSLIHINPSVGIAVLLLYFYSLLVPAETPHAHLLSSHSMKVLPWEKTTKLCKISLYRAQKLFRGATSSGFQALAVMEAADSFAFYLPTQHGIIEWLEGISFQLLAMNRDPFH